MTLENRLGARVTPPKEGAAAGGVSPEQLLLDKKIRSARRVITFERLWPRVWLPLGLALLFVVASGFGLWQVLTPAVHRGVLYGFGAVFALSFIPLFLTRRATREEAIARLQDVSGIAHRPITAYTDTFSQPAVSPEASALWQAHRQRAAALLRRMRPGSPNPRVDRHDPFALRAALVLVLAVVAAWQWTALPRQVMAAFDVPEMHDTSSLRIDAWITPPAYTRRAPFVLAQAVPAGPQAGQPSVVEAPAGSALTMKINHPSAQDFALLWQADGEDAASIAKGEQSGETFAGFGTTFAKSGRLLLQRNGRDVEAWQIDVIPDETPSIAFAGPIEVSHRSALLFKYEFSDDYGVASAEAQIERVEEGIQPGESAGGGGAATSLTPQATGPVMRLGKPPVFPLSLPRGVKAGDAKTYRDLTAHPWAGLPVIATLVAKDESGQTGYSAPRGFILPERKFTKPLARALVDQRRTLVANPAVTKTAALNLDALGRWAESEQVQPRIYLGIRSAYHRLQSDRSLESIEAVVEQLWDLAVRIEDGDLPAAERDLRAAQQRLMEALQNGASEDEIRQAMQDLRDALNRFLEAMAQKQQQTQQAERAARQPQSPADRNITANELQQLLNKIEDLAKLGAQDMAQQLLSELQDILENLQSGQESQSAESNDGMQTLDKLSELMREQQRLLDDTYRAQQEAEAQRDPFGQQRRQGQGQSEGSQRGERRQGRGPSQGEGQGEAQTAEQLRERQEALQQRLQELLDEMGQGAPPSVRDRLDDARRAMGQAGKALGEEQLGEATGQEGQALSALREGTRAMAEQMMRQPGNRQGGQGQANRDPLGRQNRGQTDPGDSVKVPEEIDIQRAREILDELRRRAGETTRPALELDYIERLIKRF